MDFFERQDDARRKTGFLVAYFALAVLVIIAAVYVVAVLIFATTTQQTSRRGVQRSPDGDRPPIGEAADEEATPQLSQWWQPDILALATLGTITIISLGSMWKIFQLRGGGEAVAASLGARRIHPTTTDPAERQVLNVVEEMALASGIPVPPVFVLKDQKSINAFAAGYSPSDAVIGVNRGTIEYLSRDELQGVIAHEFSHILNGDMRLNIRLIGILNGILLLALIGYYLMYATAVGRSTSRGRGGGGGQLVLLGMALLAIGYIGVFFAHLIKAAVSRQREYLADASAVQFTRNPDGIAGALKKIGGLTYGSRISKPEAESASHMFFGNFQKQSFMFLSTHPPLAERIRRIDPQFDGRFPRVEAPRAREEKAERPEPPRRSPFEAVRGPFGRFGVSDRLPLDPVLVLGSIGAPTRNHVEFARQVLADTPEPLREAVHDAFSARAIVFALLLDPDENIRRIQLDAVQRELGEPTERETIRLAKLVAAQGKEARLPLLEMVHSTLQELSAPQYDSFRRTVIELVKADEKIDLFEFTLQRILLRRLDRHFQHVKPPRVRYPAISGVTDEAAQLLSILAHVGHQDTESAQRAFDTAAQAFATGERPLRFCSREQCSLNMIASALDKLEASAPPIKKRLIKAATVAVATDGEVTVTEAELLRAIADSLDCPAPPLFAGSTQ